jgi:hypothetical protein
MYILYIIIEYVYNNQIISLGQLFAFIRACDHSGLGRVLVHIHQRHDPLWPSGKKIILGSIPQNSMSADNFSDIFSSSNFGQISTQKYSYKFIVGILNNNVVFKRHSIS